MEKSHKVLLTDIALLNLEELPSGHIEKILEKIELLEVFPELGFAVQSSNWQGYRQIVVDWYRVVYKIEEDKKLIVIHLVKHGKMNFK